MLALAPGDRGADAALAKAAVVIGVVVASVGGQPLGAQAGAADRSQYSRHGVEEGMSW